MRRLLRCSGIAILVIVVVVVILILLAPGGGTPTSPASPPVAAPEVYPLERGGSMTVPGGVAYMDGRDAQADPPLTVMNINVWKRPEPDRGQVACRVRHGEQVTVVDTNLHDGRRDFKIEKSGCSGWVWQLFLSTERNEPIGEQVE